MRQPLFAFLGLRCGVPPRQTHEINADGRPQVAGCRGPADRKNCTANGLVRRGRPLTSQTAFGGQLPYKGSLVRPVVMFDHSPFEYHGRLFTNHEHLSWHRLFTQVAAVRPSGRPLRYRIQAINFYVAVCRICRGCPSGRLLKKS